MMRKWFKWTILAVAAALFPYLGQAQITASKMLQDHAHLFQQVRQPAWELCPTQRLAPSIPAALLPLENLQARAAAYQPGLTFHLDPGLKFKVYTLESTKPAEVLLFVMVEGEPEPILKLVAHQSKSIPGTMSSTLRCWVEDADGDGNLDLLFRMNLVDYEFETEDAPNISGTEYYRYRIEKGALQWASWPQGFEPSGKCLLLKP